MKESLGWTFVFLGANQDAIEVGGVLGIPEESAMTFDTKNIYNAFEGLSCAVGRQVSGQEEAVAFTAAYKEAKAYLINTPAKELAKATGSFFPTIQTDVLVQCLHDYQKLGCWSEEIEITHDNYQSMLDIYEFNGGINERYAYELVCAKPPGF